jgi:hypothetical protein
LLPSVEPFSKLLLSQLLLPIALLAAAGRRCEHPDPRVHTIQVNLGLEDREKDPSALDGEIQLCGEKILIATGSSPVHPDFFLSVTAKFTIPIRS